jgi:hypothetical protein
MKYSYGALKEAPPVGAGGEDLDNLSRYDDVYRTQFCTEVNHEEPLTEAAELLLRLRLDRLLPARGGLVFEHQRHLGPPAPGLVRDLIDAGLLVRRAAVVEPSLAGAAVADALREALVPVD